MAGAGKDGVAGISASARVAGGAGNAGSDGGGSEAPVARDGSLVNARRRRWLGSLAVLSAIAAPRCSSAVGEGAARWACRQSAKLSSSRSAMDNRAGMQPVIGAMEVMGGLIREAKPQQWQRVLDIALF